MFDVLYLNDEPLVKEPFTKRRELLKKHFKEVEGEWKFANSLDTSTMEEVQVFLDESVKGSYDFSIFLKSLTQRKRILQSQTKVINKIHKNFQYIVAKKLTEAIFPLQLYLLLLYYILIL